jgi:hypothetical protein
MIRQSGLPARASAFTNSMNAVIPETKWTEPARLPSTSIATGGDIVISDSYIGP